MEISKEKKYVVKNLSNDPKIAERPGQFSLPGTRGVLKAGDSSIFNGKDIPKSLIDYASKFTGDKSGVFIKLEEYKISENISNKEDVVAVEVSTAPTSEGEEFISENQETKRGRKPRQ